MAARPQVKVYDLEGKATGNEVALPGVFTAPIRPDIVQFVHTNVRKNKRQAYSVKVHNGPTGIVAGHQHSAHSWGTGRAVSRIPRVNGSGTHRAGQAAFGNMCRGGRMFAPTKTWRKWQRKVNTRQRRYATVSALAASAVPALVMARGHKVDDVEELPIVVSNDLETQTKTQEVDKFLTAVGLDDELARVSNAPLRPGKGKMRNRRRKQKRGPLVVYDNDEGVVRAFRNLKGVDFCQVSRLNLLQLAPGGHLGRLIIWTEAAFGKLNDIFGDADGFSKQKKGYRLPRSFMTNSDLTRIINSTEVQERLKPAQQRGNKGIRKKKNPLKNIDEMRRLNPYTNQQRRAEILGTKRKRSDKTDKNVRKAQKARIYKNISA